MAVESKSLIARAQHRRGVGGTMRTVHCLSCAGGSSKRLTVHGWKVFWNLIGPLYLQPYHKMFQRWLDKYYVHVHSVVELILPHTHSPLGFHAHVQKRITLLNTEKPRFQNSTSDTQNLMSLTYFSVPLALVWNERYFSSSECLWEKEASVKSRVLRREKLNNSNKWVPFQPATDNKTEKQVNTSVKKREYWQRMFSRLYVICV